MDSQNYYDHRRIAAQSIHNTQRGSLPSIGRIFDTDQLEGSTSQEYRRLPPLADSPSHYGASTTRPSHMYADVQPQAGYPTPSTTDYYLQSSADAYPSTSRRSSHPMLYDQMPVMERNETVYAPHNSHYLSTSYPVATSPHSAGYPSPYTDSTGQLSRRHSSSSASMSERWTSPSPDPMLANPTPSYPEHAPGPDRVYSPSMHNAYRAAPYHPAALTRAPSSTGPSRHECNICGKRFSRPSGLKIHVTTHTGEKPYVCSEDGCGRAFSVQSNMRRHVRIVHQGGGDDFEEDPAEGS